MPQPVAFNTGSSISGSIQSSRISYAIETSGSDYRAGYAGKNWYSELPATTGVVFIKDTTAIGRGNPGNPAFWITNGTSSAAILATANGLPGSPRNFATTESAYSWSLANGFFINDPNEPFNQIDTDSLVLYLDASKTVSYPTTASTWYDISGNNDNGSLINGPTYNSIGAIVFDGIDDRGDISNIVNIGNPNTVTAIVKLNGLQSGSSGAGSPGTSVYGPTANGADNWLGFSGSKVNLFGTELNDINNFELNSISSLDTSNTRWYSVTSTISGSIATIYLNGIQDNTVTKSFTIGSWNSSANIGSRGANQRLFKGSISSIQAYNKALTQTEILQNYYQAPIVTNGLVFAVDAGNLVSYESGSTITYSLTGSATGSLFNGTSFSNTKGGVWSFDGADDFIQINNNASINSIYTNNQLTISSWFRYGDSGSFRNVMGILRNGDPTFLAFGWRIGSANSFFFDSSINNTRITQQLIADISPYTSSYINAVTTYTNGSMLSYVNGVLVNSGNFTGSISDFTSSNFLIGASAGYGVFKGNIAPTFLYNRALTATEIQQNFNAQRNRFNI